MPCSGGPTDDEKALQDQLKKRDEEIKYLRACLCALIRQITYQLPDMGLESFIEIASENGKVDISSFWRKHQDEDVSRMNDVLDGMSQHEKDILRELLMKND